jgi:formylglycine-generating enzyme required for sulfatase activity
VERVRLHGLGAWPDVAFVDIPAGTFMMGSPDEEVGRYRTERPQHQVNVPAFQMARTETTNAQFRVFRPQHQGPDDLPAVNVTWDEARDFCERYGWRLPTEAEWEYAARAGTHTRWSFGDDERQLGKYAWYGANAQNQPQPVGRKQANPWGLFDMHGNVWEWVQDCWHDNYDKAPTDSSAWETDKCSSRVVRGGSFGNPPVFLRSANRGNDHPEVRAVIGRFRCVRVPPA